MSPLSGKEITTIVAPATLVGESGITVIRISGPKAIEITDMLFSTSQHKLKRKDLAKQEGYTVHHGFIFKEGEALDETVVTLFKAPHSYTGEDVAELSIHGGRTMCRKIIELLLTKGCVYAEPGEFTKRAFLNGKMDLIQAEAVADLIRAKTEQAASSATMQLSGRLTDKINKLRERLIDVCSLMELELDFSEEELEIIPKDKIKSSIEEVIKTINEIAGSYEEGRVLREGMNLTITGEPNVGKSSIFNYMLNDSRAIVSDIPGTTRDYLEESLILGDIKYNLTDTAGIRTAKDEVEKMGVERSFRKIKEADIVINVYDATKIDDYTEELKRPIKKNHIIVLNKTDLLSTEPQISGKFLYISAKTGKNIDLLEKKIIKLSNQITNKAIHSEVFITNIRHRDLLTKAEENLKNALAACNEEAGNEIISFETREAVKALEEIIGKTTNTEILNNIFSKFCIGK
jgi:tRNA modification GTPase